MVLVLFWFCLSRLFIIFRCCVCNWVILWFCLMVKVVNILLVWVFLKRSVFMLKWRFFYFVRLNCFMCWFWFRFCLKDWRWIGLLRKLWNWVLLFFSCWLCSVVWCGFWVIGLRRSRCIGKVLFMLLLSNVVVIVCCIWVKLLILSVGLFRVICIVVFCFFCVGLSCC